MLQISATPRKSGETKKDGFIPAVYYGSHAKSTPIFINNLEFKKVFSQVGESSTITLKTPEGDEVALVHEIQFDPVKSIPKHVDFYIIEKGQKVDVKVPINFVGESPAVKIGNILVKVLHELPVEGEPTNLPPSFDVDISSLTDLDSVIHISDIKLPKGVTLYHVNETDVVASISEAKEEIIEEAPAPIDLTAIEVEEKGKKEEEGATEGEEGVTKA